MKLSIRIVAACCVASVASVVCIACVGGGGGASGGHQSAAVETPTELSSADNVVEVLYFHGKKRCAKCNAIERLAREVVDSLANGRVVMRVVDISENEELADRYEVTWSSLIIARGVRLENLTAAGFSYATTEPARFKASVAEVIRKLGE